LENPLDAAALREARRGLRLSRELRLPLLTVIDTPGAALSKEAEERGLAGEIARTLSELLTLPTPTVSLLMGQGAGGIALALVPADRVLASEHAWLAPLPPFSIDRLRPEFTGGDLLIQIAADDPMSVAHTARMLLKDARGFAAVHGVQHGFRQAHGTVAPGTTMRNLFGQVDGTANPRPGDADFDMVVWSTDGWLAGGTGMVVRRIRMNLDTWDEVDRGAREFAVGRRLDTGAPLTGGEEHDEPDFAAKDRLGFPVIYDLAHIRRARSADPGERIFRRAYNYDVPSTDPDSLSESGLLFISFQADVARQFTPMQERLAKADLLNIWTTPIGSAVFAVPPGCAPDGYIGETLLDG
ncbi:Dyp-type peroxidase, partial [Microbacterium sp.]|uniref:Dyp-type peroxidase n=1 Tax=Microbacterium sp. TaxID=51671 RepID=UPI0028A9AAC5